MKQLLLVPLVLLVLYLVGSKACTQSQETMTRLMKQEGVTDWKDTGYKPFSCGEHDSFSSGFTGKKNGVAVSGVVCSGVFKSYTIRYN